MKNEIYRKQINEISHIVKRVGSELFTGTVDEWDSVEDCVSATIENVTHDLTEYIKSLSGPVIELEVGDIVFGSFDGALFEGACARDLTGELRIFGLPQALLNEENSALLKKFVDSVYRKKRLIWGNEISDEYTSTNISN